MSNKKDSRTKAFGTINGKQNGFKSNNSRQKFVIAIFVVIILILASLSVLIIGKVIDKLDTTKPTSPEAPTLPDNYIEVAKDQGDIQIGNLLIVTGQKEFNYGLNHMDMSGDMTLESNLPNNIVNIYLYKRNEANISSTKILIPSTGEYAPTYELGSAQLANKVALNKTALEEFNQMIMAYCLENVDLSKYSTGSVSGLDVAWGWSNYTELQKDLNDPNYGEKFADHATGMTLTLSTIINGKRESVNQSILESNFKWIFDNAHKYGFILRYPTNCKCGSYADANKRIHLRYVGVAHATYMKENNICLDEYISLLRENYKFSSEHLVFQGADGKSYEVYYYASSGPLTHVPVPKNDEYTISGNNMDGFIITVTK